MAETVSADVIGKLREAVVSFKNSAIYKEVVEPRDAVLDGSNGTWPKRPMRCTG